MAAMRIAGANSLSRMMAANSSIPSAENARAISMSSRTCFGRPLGLPDWPFWNGLPPGLRLGLGRVLINARMSGFGDDSALAMSLEYG